MGDVHPADLDPSLSQRHRQAPGADGELDRRSAAGVPGQEIHGGVDGIGLEPVGMARVVPRRDLWAQVRVRRVEGSGHGARLDRLGPWQPGALAIFARPFPPRDSLGYVLAMTTADVRVRDMTEADVGWLRSFGFDDDAISIAVQVVGYFNYINRVADGLGTDLEPEMPREPAGWRGAFRLSSEP